MVDGSADTVEATRDGLRTWSAIRDAVSVAVVGAEPALRLLLVALLADGHVLLEDVPGVGKTLLARAFARALGLSFARVQGTPDLLPGDITGSGVLDGAAFRFLPGPVFHNVLLVDEVNRATPRTQSALLEAMQEHQVSVEGETRPLPDPFIVLATDNPIEYEGTFALPEAQLDRFLVRVRIGYPDEAGEARIARRHLTAAEPLDGVREVVPGARIVAIREAVRRTHVGDEVTAYVVALVRSTRVHPDLSLGGSPRATVGLFRAAQVWAFLDGRAFVLPDDVQAVAPAVLAHRLRLDIDRELRGASLAAVVGDVLGTTPVPPPRD
ncbi:MAG: MoxR family ATPase [Chloroflexi bacterium]|nr:MoxR family ATPase [Chloroflexota bacterium]